MATIRMSREQTPKGNHEAGEEEEEERGRGKGCTGEHGRGQGFQFQNQRHQHLRLATADASSSSCGNYSNVTRGFPTSSQANWPQQWSAGDRGAGFSSNSGGGGSGGGLQLEQAASSISSPGLSGGTPTVSSDVSSCVVRGGGGVGAGFIMGSHCPGRDSHYYSDYNNNRNYNYQDNGSRCLKQVGHRVRADAFSLPSHSRPHLRGSAGVASNSSAKQATGCWTLEDASDSSSSFQTGGNALLLASEHRSLRATTLPPLISDQSGAAVGSSSSRGSSPLITYEKKSASPVIPVLPASNTPDSCDAGMPPERPSTRNTFDKFDSFDAYSDSGMSSRSVHTSCDVVSSQYESNNLFDESLASLSGRRSSSLLRDKLEEYEDSMSRGIPSSVLEHFEDFAHVGLPRCVMCVCVCVCVRECVCVRL